MSAPSPTWSPRTEKYSEQFALTVQRWQQQHGRHHLPWQATRDPYRIWLAEIMLQQTQVSAVIGYYQRFLSRFPDLATLARATQDEVMPYWAGLGYYARARNLHRCAQTIMRDHNGAFPPNAQSIMQLPGIGRSTAAAIAAFAYGERSPILDGNVRRVFCRYFGIDGPIDHPDTKRLLWDIAENLLRAAPKQRGLCRGSIDMAAYTQGLMDLGATVCTRSAPSCRTCPLMADCHARKTGTQALLPRPKRKPPKPERSCAMLILRHGSSVLLQQRPSPGIWGGLWSLPQYDDQTVMARNWRSRNVHTAHAVRLADLQHVFTHFKLHIQPWLLDAPPDQPAPAARTEERWQSLRTLANAALPAPVRKLLEGIATLRS